jgi:hypothetical protein
VSDSGLAIASAGMLGEAVRAGLMGLQCRARRAAPRQFRSNKRLDNYYYTTASLGA